MMNKWKLARYVILFGFILVFIYTFYPHINDFKKLYQIRGSLNYFWILVAILAQASQYLDDGYFARLILKVMHFNITLKNTIQVAAIDVFAMHLFPVGQFGPLTSNFYFYKKLGLSTRAVVLFNLIMSLMGFVVMVIFLLIAVLTIPNKTFPFPVHIYLLITFSILFVLVLVGIFLAFRIAKLQKILIAILKQFNWYGFIEEKLEGIRTYKEFLFKNSRRLVTLTVLKSSWYYLADTLTLLSCFLAFHTYPGVSLVIFAYILSMIAGAVTLLPGGIGSTDITLGVIFLSANISSPVVVGAIILYRLLSFVLPIPFGAFAYYSLKKQLE